VTDLLELHSRLQVTLVLVTLTLSVCGFTLFVVRRSGGELYRAGIAIAALLFVAEAVLGLVLLAGWHAQASVLHLIYGALATICLPLVMVYNRDRSGPHVTFSYALACLFLLVLCIRTWESAG
jgi:Na+-translocating ferredoxin:NAD+ oxidoreductase RnfA subunit